MKMTTSLIIILYTFILFSGCLSNQYQVMGNVMVDQTKDIKEAQRWIPYFVERYSASGIIVELINPKMKASDIRVIIARLYPYPLDTTTIKETYLEGLSVPAPAHSVVNKTRIYYEFANKPFTARGLIDSLYQTRLNVKPNRYLILLYSYRLYEK